MSNLNQINGPAYAKNEEQKQSEIEKKEESKVQEEEDDEWEDDGEEEEYYEEGAPRTNNSQSRSGTGPTHTSHQFGNNVRTNTYRVNQGQNMETIVHQIDMNFDENNPDLSQQDMSSLQQ